MVRRASHGWSNRRQGTSRSPTSLIRKSSSPSPVLNRKKPVHLTLEQIEFLVENYDHLEDLVNERVLPLNKAGENFVKTINCGLKPSNKWEYAYWYAKKYNISFYRLKEKLNDATDAGIKQETINQQTSERTLETKLSLSKSAMRRHSQSADQYDEEIKKPKTASEVDRSQIPGAGLAIKQKKYVKKISEPLGTREDYMRDRASWKRGGT